MRHSKINVLLIASLFLSCLSLVAEGRVVILDYHSFLGNSKSNLDYSETELAAELDEIQAMGYRFVSLDDAIAGRIEGKANIVVTIDDGNHTVYPAVKDVFEPRGIKPYLFIYPAIVISHVRYALTPEQLVELAAEGCGIGSHGYHHNPVTDKAWAKDPRDFMMEINRPGPTLARILGAAPKLFAYPFGVYSTRAEQALVAAGYSLAFAADDKVRQVSFSDPELDRMAVPRTITYRYNRRNMLKSLRSLLDYEGPPLFEEPTAVSAGSLPADVAK